MDVLEKAYAYAKQKHAGQQDKAGNDYITHPKWVSDHCRFKEAKIAGLLHDTLEDTDATEAEIEELFGKKILDAVLGVTKIEGEDYISFVKRAMQNPISMEVKLMDIRNNMDLSRIDREPTASDFWRLDNKYKPAYIVLTGHPLLLSEQLDAMDEDKALEIILKLSKKNLPKRVANNIRYILLGYSNAISDELKEYIEKEI